MALEGYVEAVEPFQVRGWVYDKAAPQRGVTVELLLRNQVIASIAASLYREDLERGGVGSGDHAFIFNLDQKLAHADLPYASVRAIRADGTFEPLEKLAPVDSLTTEEKPALVFEGQAVDPDQSPVFVLGAARSGTSAVAQALLKLNRFSGHQEGHLLDLMAHLSVALERFYIEKTDERAPQRDTTVALVQEAYFQQALDETFIKVIRKMFPAGAWIDKTPNSNMVYLAPRLRRIWPKSRFIFMKRRAIENLASRRVKFPTVGFAPGCREWSQVMTAWLAVKDELAGAAIEIDQKFLNENPGATAEAIKKLLDLSDLQANRLQQAFEFDHPERTSVNQKFGKKLAEMGWDAELLATFDDICGATMKACGYSTDRRYYLPGFEGSELVIVESKSQA